MYYSSNENYSAIWDECDSKYKNSKHCGFNAWIRMGWITCNGTVFLWWEVLHRKVGMKDNKQDERV